MAKQDINIGAFVDDPNADVVREAFRKAKENFTELYGRSQGDMLKSAYDSDNTGVVDSAEKIEGVDTFQSKKYYGTDENGVPGFFDLVIKADNIVFYTDAQPRPLEGVQNTIYIDKTNFKIEIWNGTGYSVVAGGTVTKQAIIDALGYTPANDSEVVKDVQDSTGASLVDEFGVAKLPPSSEFTTDESLYLDPTTKELRANVSTYSQTLVKAGSQVFTLDFEPTNFLMVHGKTPLFDSQYTFTPPTTFEIIPLMEEGEKVRVVYERFIVQP